MTRRSDSLLPGALAYFALVWSAGFVLGVARVLLLAPRLGERSAELLELPLMLAVSYFAARLVTQRWPPAGLLPALVCGSLSLLMLLGLEFGLLPVLRGLSVDEYLASRDPVAGLAYGVALLCFALWPAWHTWRRPSGASAQ